MSLSGIEYKKRSCNENPDNELNIEKDAGWSFSSNKGSELLKTPPYNTIKLVKVVISLHSNKKLKDKRYLHLQTQTLIYNIFSFSNPELARTLHDSRTEKGFTFIPIQEIKSQNNHSNDKKTYECALEISFQLKLLFDTFIDAIFKIVEENAFLRIENTKLFIEKVSIQPPLDRNTLYAQIQALDDDEITVRFLTPTFFRNSPGLKLQISKDRETHSKAIAAASSEYSENDQQRNLDRKEGSIEIDAAIPKPIEIFTSIQRRLSFCLEYFNLDRINPNDLANHLEIEDIVEHKSESAPIFRNNTYWEKNKGFTGIIKYRIIGNSEIHNYIKAIFIIGQYFGIGSRPSLGFGQIKMKAQIP